MDRDRKSKWWQESNRLIVQVADFSAYELWPKPCTDFNAYELWPKPCTDFSAYELWPKPCTYDARQSLSLIQIVLA